MKRLRVAFVATVTGMLLTACVSTAERTRSAEEQAIAEVERCFGAGNPFTINACMTLAEGPLLQGRYRAQALAFREARSRYVEAASRQSSSDIRRTSLEVARIWEQLLATRERNEAIAHDAELYGLMMQLPAYRPVAQAAMARRMGVELRQCDFPGQVASDGSICGDRAASVRPGGR